MIQGLDFSPDSYLCLGESVWAQCGLCGDSRDTRHGQYSPSGESSTVAPCDVSRIWGLIRELRGEGPGLIPGRGIEVTCTQLKRWRSSGLCSHRKWPQGWPVIKEAKKQELCRMRLEGSYFCAHLGFLAEPQGSHLAASLDPESLRGPCLEQR